MTLSLADGTALLIGSSPDILLCRCNSDDLFLFYDKASWVDKKTGEPLVCPYLSKTKVFYCERFNKYFDGCNSRYSGLIPLPECTSRPEIQAELLLLEL